MTRRLLRQRLALRLCRRRHRKRHARLLGVRQWSQHHAQRLAAPTVSTAPRRRSLADSGTSIRSPAAVIRIRWPVGCNCGLAPERRDQYLYERQHAHLLRDREPGRRQHGCTFRWTDGATFGGSVSGGTDLRRWTMLRTRRGEPRTDAVSATGLAAPAPASRPLLEHRHHFGGGAIGHITGRNAVRTWQVGRPIATLGGLTLASPPLRFDRRQRYDTFNITGTRTNAARGAATTRCLCGQAKVTTTLDGGPGATRSITRAIRRRSLSTCRRTSWARRWFGHGIENVTGGLGMTT